jgi:hypothetical protein
MKADTFIHSCFLLSAGGAKVQAVSSPDADCDFLV